MKKFVISLIIASSFSSLAKAEMIQNANTAFQASIKPLTTEILNEIAPISATPKPKTTTFKNQNQSSTFEGFQIGVGAGILGGGNVQLGYRIPQREHNFWKNRFGFRIEYNTWKPFESMIEEKTIEIDDNEFSAQITGDNFGALLDFYPFGNTWGLGNFRISAGYYSGDFSLSGNLTKHANETFTMDNILGQELTYKVDGTATLTANLDYDVKGPYAGIGFDTALFGGLKLYFDAGVVFTDKPILTSDISGNATMEVFTENGISLGTTSVNAKDNPLVQDLLYDTIGQYQDELDKITKEYFPMVKLGFLYRF